MFGKLNRGMRGNNSDQNSSEDFCGSVRERKDCSPCDFSLSGVGRGCCCRIRRHHAHGAVRQRLLDMGLIPNAEVEVLRVAPLGDPMEVKVATSFVTLRKREADLIEIINN